MSLAKFESLAEFRKDLTSKRAMPSLFCGFTAGLGLLIAQIAFGTFIFSGDLAPYAAQGVGLILFGNFAVCLIVALIGGYRGSISGLSPALVVVMATVVSAIDASGEELFLTAVLALILSAVITGICCLLLGQFKLAKLMRFIPYPVTAGFVAGIGGLVIFAAMSMMGADTLWQSSAWDVPVLLTWIPGVIFGVMLYAATTHWRQPMILPVTVVVLIVLYQLGIIAFDMSREEAAMTGILLQSTTEGALWPAIEPSDLAKVQWATIMADIPIMLTLILFAIIAVAMNVAGLELVVRKDLNWDREFKVSGIASIVAGLGGCTVSTLVVPATLRNVLLGAATRLTGVVAALVIGVALVFGDKMLNYVPTALIGGILIYAGLGMLDQSLVKTQKTLPRSEYGIVVLIFTLVLIFGIFQGVAIGLLVAVVFLVVRLSRINPIETHVSAKNCRSHKTRSIPERAILAKESKRLHVYRLRGYIFFGSVQPLVETLKAQFSRPTPPSCLVIDFTSVSGLDFSAISALSRHLQSSYKHNVKVALSAIPQQLRTGLEQNLPPIVFADLYLTDNEDQALEQCEDILIENWRKEAIIKDSQRDSILNLASDDLESYLEHQTNFEEIVEALKARFPSAVFAPGAVVLRIDSPSEDVHLLISGSVEICDTDGSRYYEFVPGEAISIFGDLDIQASVALAKTQSEILTLRPADRYWLEENEVELAIRLYRYLLPVGISSVSSYGYQGNS